MRYGVVINLDYTTHAYKDVHAVFLEIEAELAAQGFRREGRIFVAGLPAGEAAHRAREAVDAVDARRPEGDGPYRYIRDFFGFDYGQADNLMLPEGEITVEEFEGMDIGRVERFYPKES